MVETSVTGVGRAGVCIVKAELDMYSGLNKADV